MRPHWRLAAWLGLSLVLASTAFGQPAKNDAPKPERPKLPVCDEKFEFGKEPEPRKEGEKPKPPPTAEEIEKQKQALARCVTDLDASRTAYADAQRSLAKSVTDKDANAVIEKAEKAAAAARTKYLEKMDACSSACAIRRVKQIKIASPEKTELWYESEGTCVFDEAKFGKTAFDKIVKFLSQTDNYAAYKAVPGGAADARTFNPNGLRNLLEFVPVDPEEGIQRPEWKTFDKKFPVFIAVLGPTFLGETISTNYFIENTLKSEKMPWHLEFKSVPKVAGFKAPKVYVHSSVPKKREETRPFTLNSVLGSWCVRKNSFTYYTAADFGAAGAISSFTTTLAKSVLLETLAHVYEIGIEAKP